MTARVALAAVCLAGCGGAPGPCVDAAREMAEWFDARPTAVAELRADAVEAFIDKPWTAVAGLRRRVFEPFAPGSYGAAARRAIR